MNATNNAVCPIPDTSQAVVELVDRDYRGPLLTLIQRRLFSRLGKRVDSEDLLQNVLIEVFKKWPSFGKSGMTFWHWLCRLTVTEINKAARDNDRQRNTIKREVGASGQSPNGAVSQIAASATGPSSAAARNERREQVRRAIETLDPSDREILSMRHFQGLSYEQIGQKLEIPPNTAAMRYHRATNRMKELCKDLLDEGASKS